MKEEKIFRTGILSVHIVNIRSSLILGYLVLSVMLINGCTKDQYGNMDNTVPVINAVLPSANASAVAGNIQVMVTFSEAMNASTINNTTFTLKQGATQVAGNVTYSQNVATFTPAAVLAEGTAYTATVTTGVRDAAGNSLAANYSWSFTTATIADVTAPTVSAVTPSTNATGITLNSALTIKFSEAMNAGTISATTITLKQGTTAVTGTVTYSTSTNTATFTPTAALSGGLVYTAIVTTGVKDAAGNALAANYSWSFTTGAIADVIAPTVSVVTPSPNATGIALNSALTIKFSEAMNAGTISATTITFKQGTAAITGTVTYSTSTNTATFTPTAALSGGLVYTATVTTGVKDAAGNSLAANYSWSFTTVAAAAGVSFSGDVVPILNKCNTCHTHGWTTSSNASTFYTNLVNANYVNPASPTSSKIYSRINSGHPSSTVTSAEKTKILTWMSEGSKNN